MSRNKAQIVAVMGASGSGKSLYVKRELLKTGPSRLMIWDPMREYGASGVVMSRLSDVLEAVKQQRFAVVFQPSGDSAAAKKQFDVFCRIGHAAGNLTMVCEELSFVTSASWAPAGWSMVTLTGRHKGMKVFGLSQRPASIDKNFFGNATRIRTGRLNFERDVKVLADVLQVPAEKVRGLQPLDFIERDMATGKNTTGRQKI